MSQYTINNARLQTFLPCRPFNENMRQVLFYCFHLLGKAVLVLELEMSVVSSTLLDDADRRWAGSHRFF